jgi:ABC-type polysaccharide/polyol phosphate export permease
MEVLRALTVAELRVTQDLTVVGIFKWMLEPLSYMAVYYLLIGVVLGAAQNRDYPLFLLAGLVQFRYFTGVVNGSMSVLTRFGAAITNRAFPRWVLPLVLAAAEVPTLLLSLLLFVPLMAASGIGPSPALVWIPIIVLVLALVSIGPAYLMAVFGLYFPDFRGAAQNLIRVTYFVSTGLFPASFAQGDILPLLPKLNPLSGVFDAMRAVVMFGKAPKAFDLLYPALAGLVFLALGGSLYRWRQHQFAKEL